MKTNTNITVICEGLTSFLDFEENFFDNQSTEKIIKFMIFLIEVN